MLDFAMSLPTTHSGGKPLYFTIVSDTVRGPFMGWQLWSMEKSGEISEDTIVWSPHTSYLDKLKFVLMDLCYPPQPLGVSVGSMSAVTSRTSAMRSVRPPPKELGFLTPDMIDRGSLPAESLLDAPARMRVAEAATVSYRITQLGQVASDNALQIRMTSLMGARLTGLGFEIVAEGTDIKATSPCEENVWTWNVTPKERGKRSLKVVVTGHVMLKGRSMPTEFVAETRVIDVKVSFGGYFQQNWMALAGLVLAAMSLPYWSDWLKPLLKWKLY